MFQKLIFIKKSSFNHYSEKTCPLRKSSEGPSFISDGNE
jgi:hypothetical protein